MSDFEQVLSSLVADGALSATAGDRLQTVVRGLPAEQQAALRTAAAILSARSEADRQYFESKQTPFPDYHLRPLIQTTEHYQARVCLIQTPTKRGTGFLVDPDIILTNYHVIEDMRDCRADSQAVTGTEIFFDMAADYDSSQRRPSRATLHKQDWLLASSPYSSAEANGNFDAPAPADCLDFALLRLSAARGKDTVEFLRGQKRERGHFDLGECAELPQPGTAVFIFHHPLEGKASD
ncbi:MAG: trypsin-like serine peptidase, partial [Deltaproteobacteria bacterium]